MIHDECNDINPVAIHHMRDNIPIMTSDLVFVATLRHESDSGNLIDHSWMVPQTLHPSKCLGIPTLAGS